MVIVGDVADRAGSVYVCAVYNESLPLISLRRNTMANAPAVEGRSPSSVAVRAFAVSGRVLLGEPPLEVPLDAPREPSPRSLFDFPFFSLSPWREREEGVDLSCIDFFPLLFLSFMGWLLYTNARKVPVVKGC